jgi:hypothetical protein
MLLQGWAGVLENLIASVIALLPLFLFVALFQRIVLGSPIRNLGQVCFGIGISIVGLFLLYQGLKQALIPLGNSVGEALPGASGLGVIILFALILGYGATIAEPALRVLGLEVEETTAGAFKKNLLIHAVAIGVAAGVCAGILRLVFEIPLLYLVLPGVAVVALLSIFSSPEHLAIAWDSAGVTTGPVTVPLTIALGLGVAGGGEGFGIITMGSLGPIAAVLGVGLILKWKRGVRHDRGR